MNIPILIQHGERRSAASLVIVDMAKGERYELLPTQHFTVHVLDGETRVVELIAAPWSGSDPACTFPVTIAALREPGRALHVRVVGAASREVEIPAGQLHSLELSSAEDLVLEIHAGEAPAAASGRGGKSGRRPGRSQVKPRQNRGRKAGR